MSWIVLVPACIFCGLLLYCVCRLLRKVRRLERQVARLKMELGIERTFAGYSRIYLDDTLVGNGRQVRIRSDIYMKISRVLPLIAPKVSASSYVSNIVEEHMKRYGGLLNEEIEYYMYNGVLWKN